MNGARIEIESSFYVTGGTLDRDAACYVVRQADRQLYDGLRRGQFCYVLTARQMGKSSLMVRTAARLREEGVGVAVLDLTAHGQNLTAEQWYSGLLIQMAQQLELEDELDEFWDTHRRLGPMERWMQAVRQIVLPSYPGPVTIFVDEIDTMRSLPFSTDEFFAAIREFYNRRTEDEELKRLTFCLLGVASPSDLIRDTRTTPFNIGLRIELYDFTEPEAAPLARGLEREERVGAAMLKRILYWTGGHPYLTQRLCLAAVEDASVSRSDGIDRLCEELFLTRKAKEQDDNLLFVRERMLRSEEDLAGLLTHYAQVRRGKRIEDDETCSCTTALKLSGIARVDNGRLRVRNRIYEGVFDREWVGTNMPDAEVRRQRAAYRRGLLRAAAIAAVIIAAVASLAVVAIRQRNRARQQEEANRRLLYAAEMNLAGQAWEDAGITRMMDLLNNHLPKPGQEDLRGFEWYYLWGLGNSELRSIRIGEYAVVAFFPDNRRLLTGGDDNIVKVWDVVTGQQLMALSGHSDEINRVAVSPDGQTLASISDDQTARVWNAVTGQEMATLRGHTDRLTNLAFSSDGRTLATTSYDKTVRLWDVASGQELFTLAHPDDTFSVAFSPNGKTVATGCGVLGDTMLWDAATGKEARTFKSEKRGDTHALAFSPDGATLVTGSGRWIEFWDVTTGKIITATGLTGSQQPRQKVIEILGAVMSVSFSPNGDALAVASSDRTVNLYSVATLTQLKTFKGHGLLVFDVAFSRNGRLLATSGGDGMVKLWDVEAGQDSGLNSQASIYRLAFSPDGHYLAAVTSVDPKAASLWDVKTREEIRSFHGHTGFIAPIEFSPDGQRLATGSNDKTVKLWDVATGQEIATLKGHTSYLESVAFSPDGQRLATGGTDNTTRLWDIRAGRELITLRGHTKSVKGVAFSPDGRRLATGSDDKTAKIWDAITYQEIANFHHTGPVNSVAFSPDGRSLGTASSDGLAQLWDLSTGKVQSVFKGHVGGVGNLQFFPDGRRLATAAGDNTVKLWDVSTGQELLSLRNPGRFVISPDGKVMASNGRGGGSLKFMGDPATSAESKLTRLRELTTEEKP